MNEGIEDLLARLHSIDANDRVKAAADLGEYGTPVIAKEVLKAAWEDEASTVRQIAIQSYYKILKNKATDEIIHAAKFHLDEYVKIYAISVLGSLNPSLVAQPLAELLNNENPKIRSTSLRSMIHAGIKENVDIVYTRLEIETNDLALKNSIELLALWRYKKSKEKIAKIIENTNSEEVKTMGLFALASFGDKKSKKALETCYDDEYIRIIVKNKTYRGKNGLLEALKYI